jgi:hypothetical protein
MSKPRLSGILLAGAACLLGATALAAPREYQVFQTDHPPFIDGDVRDDIWRAVPWSGDFTGLQGAAADVQTQFAMAWDEKFLYVAVRCKEPRPEAIHAEITGRDPRIVNDDHIEILLASPDKPAACLRIFLNPAGGRVGQWIEEGRPENAPEDRWLRLEQAGLDSAVRVHAGEWVIEAALPLPSIEFPLKEGQAYAGNICRVRPGAPVKEMAWSPVQRDLRQSAAFGLFKLCGPAPKAPPVQSGDTVCLRNNDRINGNLLRLADGKIRFSSPTFAEEVSFSADEVERLDLAWTEVDAAPARFFLNNGDQISGKVASLSAETLDIESPSLGRVSIPRGLLSNISLSGFWLDSRFETGVLKPWELVSGSCNFAKGLLHLSGETPGGQYQAILSLPLHQDKTVTLIADYDPTPPLTPLHIQLFADRAHPQMQIRDGIMFHLITSAVFVVYNDGQASSPPTPRQRLTQPTGKEPARIKVTYDPSDGYAEAWYNGKQVAEITTPEGPREGAYVIFGATRPLALRRLAVYCGLPAPEHPLAGPKPGEILSYLSNGDAVRASQVEFADGHFVFTTEFGPMKVSPDRVVGIAFPAQAEKPPAAESAALVETSGSRLALDVEAITDDFVIGKSPDLGELKLSRRVVKSISFPAS